MFKFFSDISIHDLFLALASDEVMKPQFTISENSQYHVIMDYFNATIAKIKKDAQNGLGGIDSAKYDAALMKITASIPQSGITQDNVGLLKTIAYSYTLKIESLLDEEQKQAAAQQFFNFDSGENEYDFMEAQEFLQHHEIGQALAYAMAARIEERLNNAPQEKEETQPSSRNCILQ